jgi:hypothetical protein
MKFSFDSVKFYILTPVFIFFLAAFAPLTLQATVQLRAKI